MGTCPAADGSHWPAIAATTRATSSGAAVQNQARLSGSVLDARTVRHRGYAISQWGRKRVEETFGWMKTVGGLRRNRYGAE
jgi:hypothetical protein